MSVTEPSRAAKLRPQHGIAARLREIVTTSRNRACRPTPVHHAAGPRAADSFLRRRAESSDSRTARNCRAPRIRSGVPRPAACRPGPDIVRRRYRRSWLRSRRGNKSWASEAPSTSTMMRLLSAERLSISRYRPGKVRAKRGVTLLRGGVDPAVRALRSAVSAPPVWTCRVES